MITNSNTDETNQCKGLEFDGDYYDREGGREKIYQRYSRDL